VELFKSKYNFLLYNINKFWITFIIQTLLILFIPQKAIAQKITFKIKQDGITQKQFFIKAFNKKGYQLFKSQDSILTIDTSLVNRVDSLKLYYSFYEEMFDLNQLNSGVYKTNPQLSLETVVINGNKERSLFKLKGNSVTAFNRTYAAHTIKTDRFNASTLNGIELYFKKSGKLRFMGSKLRFNNTAQSFKLIVAL
jgi:hypothetical protein